MNSRRQATLVACCVLLVQLGAVLGPTRSWASHEPTHIDGEIPGGGDVPTNCNAHAYGVSVSWNNGFWFLTDWWEGSARGRGVCDKRTYQAIEVTLKAEAGTSDEGANVCQNASSCIAQTSNNPKATVKNVANVSECFLSKISGHFAGPPDSAPQDNAERVCT